MLLSCLFVYNNVIGYVGGTGAISDCLLKNVLILFRSTVHPKTRRLVTIECITSWKCCGIARPSSISIWWNPMFMSSLEKTVLPFISSCASSTVGIQNFSLWIASLACLMSTHIWASSLFGLGAITAGLSQVVVPEPCPKCQGLEARQSLCRLYLSKGKGSTLVSGLLV